MTRRTTTRIYPVGENRFVQISKEWEMKFRANLWYVYEYGSEHPKTLGRFRTLTEARQFVRDGAVAALAFAAALWLTAAPAQAFCGFPNYHTREEEMAYRQCEAQERQAEAMERQNRIIQEQFRQQQWQLHQLYR